jgi:L-lactate dehydrogenase complex protein LldE
MPPVQLLHTCLVNEIDPDVGQAVVRILERLGYSVAVPLEQTCCGQPAFNAGFQDEARVAARHTIQVFEATEGTVIIPSGSCGDMVIHQYKALFAHDDEWRRRAERLAGRCEEFSAFVARHPALTARLYTTIAYHPSCHLLRGLGVATQPKALLQGIEGVKVVDVEAADECCGFGGLFSIKHSDISGRMLERKIDNLVASGAKRLVSCDLGCLLHLSGGLHRKAIDMRVQHLAQVLDEASS